LKNTITSLTAFAVLALTACGGDGSERVNNTLPADSATQSAAQQAEQVAPAEELSEEQIHQWDVLQQEGVNLAIEGKWRVAEKKFLAAKDLLADRRDHRYAMTARELGQICAAKNDWQAARKYYQEDYDIQVADLGPDDSAVVLPLSRIGTADLRLKDIRSAKTKLNKAIEIQRKQSMPNLKTEAILLERLAQVHLEAGEPKNALEVAKKSVELWQSPKLDVGGADMLSIWRTLGASYMATNNFKEAENCYVKARYISDSYDGYSAGLLDRVDAARACEGQGALDRADRIFQEALKRGNTAVKECRALPHKQDQLAQIEYHLKSAYMAYADYLSRHGKATLAQQMRTKASQP
jgi:tetratricopeptide (TPR) repeat protein